MLDISCSILISDKIKKSFKKIKQKTMTKTGFMEEEEKKKVFYY